ncbi:hypothetical protein K1719_028292 [Acacia pycnantha]|nr:hypothetical protein K1719_028292 [Acacia pycnantha]
MARLPLDPFYSKALILASQFNCLEEMLITVAMLSVESIFYAPRDKLEEARTAMKCFSSPEGDHLTLINVRSLKHALDIHKQILGNVEQMGLQIASCGDDMLPYCRCLAASFLLNAVVKEPEGTYRALASGQVVQIHPSSVLFQQKPECIIFNELVQTNNKYIRNLTRIDYLWLTELAPQYFAVQN